MKTVGGLFFVSVGAAMAEAIACGGHTGGAGSESGSSSGTQDGGEGSSGNTSGNATTTGASSGGGSGSGSNSGTQDSGGSGSGSNGGSGASSGSPKTCASNADCPPNMGCGFKISDDCSAVGACLDIEVGAGACDAGGPLACSCSGATVSGSLCNYPDGFLPYPVHHEGACTGDSGAD